MMAAPFYIALSREVAGCVFWCGIAVLLSTFVAIILEAAGARDKNQVFGPPFVVMAVGIIVFCAGAAWYFWPQEKTPPAAQEKNLPGFSALAYLRMYDTLESRRRYIFQLSNPEGGKAEFFLSASDIFTFSMTDIHGESYALDVPYGAGGIPIDRYVFLYCDAEVDGKVTILRIFIDAKQIQSRTFDLPIEFGSNNWHLTLGADNHGQNNAPFKMAEFGAGHETFTETQIKSHYNDFIQFLRNINSAITP